MKPADFRRASQCNWGAVKEMFIIEFRVFMQSRTMLFSEVVMPLMYFVFIVSSLTRTIGDVTFAGRSLPYQEYAMVGLLSMQMMMQMHRAIYRMVEGRRYGFFALEMQSGVKPLWYILAMSTSSVLGYTLQTLVFCLLVLICGMSISVRNFAVMWVTALVGLYFWIGVATFIAMQIDSLQIRNTVMTFILTPLAFSAPSFYVLRDAPFFVQLIAAVNPLTYQLQAIREAAFGAFSPASLGIVAVFSLAVLGAASWSVGRAGLMTRDNR